MSVEKYTIPQTAQRLEEAMDKQPFSDEHEKIIRKVIESPEPVSIKLRRQLYAAIASSNGQDGDFVNNRQLALLEATSFLADAKQGVSIDAHNRNEGLALANERIDDFDRLRGS